MLEQFFRLKRVVFGRCKVGLHLKVFLRRRVQVFLARLVQQGLVSRLSEETYVEPAHCVLVISFVNDLDKVVLLEQPDGVLHTLRTVSAFGGEGCDVRESFELEFFAKD